MHYVQALPSRHAHHYGHGYSEFFLDAPLRRSVGVHASHNLRRASPCQVRRWQRYDGARIFSRQSFATIFFATCRRDALLYHASQRFSPTSAKIIDYRQRAIPPPPYPSIQTTVNALPKCLMCAAFVKMHARH